MASEYKYDVFLSHNNADKSRIRDLANKLRDAGLRVWFDEWIIKPGDDIYISIERGLEEARVQILCLSTAALDSDWVKLERSTVLFRDPGNEGRRFVPLLLTDCNLPDALKRYKYVDYRRQSKRAFAELLNVCYETEGANAKTSLAREAPLSTKKAKKNAKRRAKQIVTKEIELVGHTNYVYELVCSNDAFVFSCSADNTVRNWDLTTSKQTILPTRFNVRVLEIDLTPNGKRILCCPDLDDFSVWVVDTKSGEIITKFLGHTDRLRSVIALSDGERALSCGDDQTIRIWNIDTGKCLKLLRSNSGKSADCLAASDDSKFIFAGERTGRLTKWNIKTGIQEWSFNGHRKDICSIKLSPNGQYILTGSADGTIGFWDADNGKNLARFEGHDSEVINIDVSPTGQLIASVCPNDSTIRIWNIQTGTCIQIIRKHGAISCAFTRDGEHLLVGFADKPFNIVKYRISYENISVDNTETKRYTNAKIVLLGEGAVGKTSLAYRLIEDKYVIKDRTHGMNVFHLELPKPSNDIIEREALLWDLAGQEDYRLIHRLYLGETALALLLINPQTNNPFVQAGDWLKALETSSNQDITKLLVFSQVDVGEPKLGTSKIVEFCKKYGFDDWILTSAKNGRNCSDKENNNEPSRLKNLIANSIPWNKLPWTSSTRLLSELKKAIIAIRDKHDIRLLRFAELAQRLEQTLLKEKFGESDIRTAITLLSNHGLVLPLNFGDLILLQPELLNGYASAIIRSARAHTDEIGSVLENKIYNPSFDFTGVERLKHRPDEELLLRALVQNLINNSLCIVENTDQGRHLVFPSQYRREKDMPRDPDIFVSYTFSGEWQTIWTSLVVRLWYSKEFEHRELWRNAAEFASSKGHILGLKINNQEGEGIASISLYFDIKIPDELKTIFIEYVHNHLAKFGCEVKRDRHYVCPNCGKVVTDIEEVRKRLEKRKNFIYCQRCDKKIELIDFIEKRLNSDPVAAKILSMEAIATKQIDAQALEQILIGHMMAITGEANQIFRPLSMFDYGIDGEVEFKDDQGNASGNKIYVQLKSGNSYLRKRKFDGSEIFDVKNERHLDYWISQPVDVYLVVRQTDEISNSETIRWMNITEYLKSRHNKSGRQIIFTGEKLDMEAIWKARDNFFK